MDSFLSLFLPLSLSLSMGLVLSHSLSLFLSLSLSVYFSLFLSLSQSFSLKHFLYLVLKSHCIYHLCMHIFFLFQPLSHSFSFNLAGFHLLGTTLFIYFLLSLPLFCIQLCHLPTKQLNFILYQQQQPLLPKKILTLSYIR